MLDGNQAIDAPSCFEARAVRVVREWREADEPITLSINGKLTFLIEDDATYEKLVGLVQWLANVEDLRERLKDFSEGKPGISIEEARGAIHNANGLPR